MIESNKMSKSDLIDRVLQVKVLTRISHLQSQLTETELAR